MILLALEKDSGEERTEVHEALWLERHILHS